MADTPMRPKSVETKNSRRTHAQASCTVTQGDTWPLYRKDRKRYGPGDTRSALIPLERPLLWCELTLVHGALPPS